MMSTEPHADVADGTEELLRRALSDAALAAEPPPWSAAAVRERMLRVRRRRRLAVTMPLVAVAALVTGLLLPGRGAPAVRDTHEATPPPAVSAPPRPRTSPSPTASAAGGSAAGAYVVEPGRRFAIGSGMWASLTADQYCLDHGGSPKCARVATPHTGASALALDTVNDSSGLLCVPVYTGPGRPVRITFRRSGIVVEQQAQAVTLPGGNPRYATAFFWGPPLARGSGEHVTITAYDGQGSVLTSLDADL